MSRILKLFLMCILLVLYAGCQKVEEQKGSVEIKILPGYLVESEELTSSTNSPDVVIVDARSAEKYQTAHIPNAVNIPKTVFRTPEDLEYKKNNGFAISPEKTEKVFGDAGIGADSRVIVYDSITFPDASIIWTLLKYYGHDNVQVLKGGYEKWVSEGHPVTQEIKIPPHPPLLKGGREDYPFKAKPKPEMVATLSWILNKKKDMTILDMRSFAEYIGTNTAGNKRGGSIPGAINIEWVELAGDSTIKSAEEIQRVLNKYGINKEKEIVTYCNWGIGRSTYGFMLLKMLGFEKVRVYGGSMEEWSAKADLPIGDVKNIPADL
ncbi:MAG: sulfurtransferase [Nitrospinae bacterium]|nr:sulfurtransferase [Nitrospinota bacterium]